MAKSLNRPHFPWRMVQVFILLKNLFYAIIIEVYPKELIVATHHFTPYSRKFPGPRTRLLKLQGWLELEGEEVQVRISKPAQEGMWCDGVIEKSTSPYFKPGKRVNILPDTCTFLLEYK